jgi:hypothetical protein
MFSISIPKHAIQIASAALIFGLLSPANASYRQGSVNVFPDFPTSTIADRAEAKSAYARNQPKLLTSRLPWLAPTGHRQPRRVDAPQSEGLSAWERQQLLFDRDLDRRLRICRGC